MTWRLGGLVFWIVMEPWMRLNGNNFASLQLKERILVPTISTMTYSGKPQQKSKAKRSWKIWMEKTTWTRTSEKMEVRNVFEVTKGQDFQWHQNFATTNGPVCACMRGFYVDVSLTKWIHLGRLMRKSNQDSDGQACCCQAPCTMCIAPW